MHQQAEAGTKHTRYQYSNLPSDCSGVRTPPPYKTSSRPKSWFLSKWNFVQVSAVSCRLLVLYWLLKLEQSFILKDIRILVDLNSCVEAVRTPHPTVTRQLTLVEIITVKRKTASELVRLPEYITLVVIGKISQYILKAPKLSNFFRKFFKVSFENFRKFFKVLKWSEMDIALWKSTQKSFLLTFLFFTYAVWVSKHFSKISRSPKMVWNGFFAMNEPSNVILLLSSFFFT